LGNRLFLLRFDPFSHRLEPRSMNAGILFDLCHWAEPAGIESIDEPITPFSPPKVVALPPWRLGENKRRIPPYCDARKRAEAFIASSRSIA
jgi:hypothetical protein